MSIYVYLTIAITLDLHLVLAGSFPIIPMHLLQLALCGISEHITLHELQNQLHLTLSIKTIGLVNIL